MLNVRFGKLYRIIREPGDRLGQGNEIHGFKIEKARRQLKRDDGLFLNGASLDQRTANGVGNGGGLDHPYVLVLSRREPNSETEQPSITSTELFT